MRKPVAVADATGGGAKWRDYRAPTIGGSLATAPEAAGGHEMGRSVTLARLRRKNAAAPEALSAEHAAEVHNKPAQSKFQCDIDDSCRADSTAKLRRSREAPAAADAEPIIESLFIACDARVAASKARRGALRSGQASRDEHDAP